MDCFGFVADPEVRVSSRMKQQLATKETVARRRELWFALSRAGCGEVHNDFRDDSHIKDGTIHLHDVFIAVVAAIDTASRPTIAPSLS